MIITAEETEIVENEENAHGNDELPAHTHCINEKPSIFSESEIEKLYSSYMIFEVVFTFIIFVIILMCNGNTLFVLLFIFEKRHKFYFFHKFNFFRHLFVP